MLSAYYYILFVLYELIAIPKEQSTQTQPTFFVILIH
jgi:hypothetical protein